jgi:hypothetical protein
MQVDRGYNWKTPSGDTGGREGRWESGRAKRWQLELCLLLCEMGLWYDSLLKLQNLCQRPVASALVPQKRLSSKVFLVLFSYSAGNQNQDLVLASQALYYWVRFSVFWFRFTLFLDFNFAVKFHFWCSFLVLLISVSDSCDKRLFSCDVCKELKKWIVLFSVVKSQRLRIRMDFLKLILGTQEILKTVTLYHKRPMSWHNINDFAYRNSF